MDGIERGLDLPRPVAVDPASLSEKEREELGAVRLPASLEEAIDNLERDAVLLEALGERLAASYLAVKRSNIAAFAAQDEAFEFSQHFSKF
jgi:glutamine synthetase